jgi:hypothetical protein
LQPRVSLPLKRLPPETNQAALDLKFQLLIEADSRPILFNNFQDEQPVLPLSGLGYDLPHQPFANPLASPLWGDTHRRYPAGPTPPGHQGHAGRLFSFQHNLAGG